MYRVFMAQMMPNYQYPGLEFGDKINKTAGLVVHKFYRTRKFVKRSKSYYEKKTFYTVSQLSCS